MGIANPDVSVIMPTYNRGYVIKRAIDSVLIQSYSNFELIIIDDGSVDNTSQLIADYSDERIKYIALSSNKGACFARNRGMLESIGEYLAFIDSDNVWNAEYLEKRIQTFGDKGPDTGMVWGRAQIICEDGSERQFPDDTFVDAISLSDDGMIVIKEMLKDNVVDTNTAMIKRECYERVGGFCEQLRRLQDWEFFFRVFIKSGYKAVFTDDCLVCNYVLNDSISSAKNDRAYWESRKYFLDQYGDEYQKYGYDEDILKFLCMKEQPQLTPEAIKILMDGVEQEKIYDVILNYNSVYFDMIHQYEDQLNESRHQNEIYHWLHCKEEKIIDVMNVMVSAIQDQVDFGELLKNEGFNRVSVYGLGKLGKILCNELISSGFELTSIIDRCVSGEYKNIEVVTPDSYADRDDVVIVTVMDEYESIKDQYEQNTPFISLETIIHNYEKGRTK